MAATENKLKQRIVGALVLIALAVIFLPMLLKQDEPVGTVTVQAPAMPEVPKVPEYPVQQVAVPVPEPESVPEDIWEDAQITDAPSPVESAQSAPASSAAVAQPQQPQEPAPVVNTAPKEVVAPGIDSNNLPLSWSVQLASLTHKGNAEGLRDRYRKKHYNAYVRSSGDIHRVLVGPLIKRAEAQTLCNTLKSREGQECFVVRYQP